MRNENENLIEKAARFLLESRKKQRWKRGMVFLAGIVVFVTTYALILPAITLELDSGDLLQDSFMYDISEGFEEALDESADVYIEDGYDDSYFDSSDEVYNAYEANDDDYDTYDNEIIPPDVDFEGESEALSEEETEESTDNSDDNTDENSDDSFGEKSEGEAVSDEGKSEDVKSEDGEKPKGETEFEDVTNSGGIAEAEGEAQTEAVTEQAAENPEGGQEPERVGSDSSESKPIAAYDTVDEVTEESGERETTTEAQADDETEETTAETEKGENSSSEDEIIAMNTLINAIVPEGVNAVNAINAINAVNAEGTYETLGNFRFWFRCVFDDGDLVYDLNITLEKNDIIKYTDTGGEVYYLVPINYMQENLAQWGYRFDPNVCPFKYVPSAYSDAGNKATHTGIGEYMLYNDSYYLKVQDTGSYRNGPPRSNIIYYGDSHTAADLNNVNLVAYKNGGEDESLDNVSLEGTLFYVDASNTNFDRFYLLPLDALRDAYAEKGITVNTADPDGFSYSVNSGDKTAAVFEEYNGANYLKVSYREGAAYTVYYDYTAEVYLQTPIKVNFHQLGHSDEIVQTGLIDDTVYYQNKSGDEFYLVPLKYFENAYGAKDYTYSEGEDCPFKYRLLSDETDFDAGYKTYEGNVYVMIKAAADESGETKEIVGNVYYTYYDELFEPQEELRIWVQEYSYSGGYSSSIVLNTQNAPYNDVMEGVYKYTDLNNEIWYLIPVDPYFNEVFYDKYDVEFDPDVHPFRYAPDANYSSANLTYADFKEYNGKWYVKIQDTGNYGSPPRSNIYFVQMNKRTDTISSGNSVINVFDYWLEDRYGNDNKSTGTLLESGINEGHPLKFVWQSTGSDAGNQWTRSASPRTGLVKNTLDGGYPYLSGTGFSKAESLDYLFNPNIESDYKKSFKDVKGLLTIDESGYYHYEADKYFAELNEKANRFTVYDAPKHTAGGSKGGFFPFNKYCEVYNISDQDPKINHYFGVSVTSRFIQENGGKDGEGENANDVIFNFTGDDDVWVFIDDVLVGDIGGIHDATTLEINFRTGNISVNGSVTSTIKQQYTYAGAADTTLWSETNPNTYADETNHIMKFFYLERGNNSSNMQLKYNLIEVPITSIYKIDQYGDKIEGAGFSVYKSNEDYTYLTDDGERISLEGENYVINSEGIITVKGKTITPVFTGETDELGSLEFLKEDGTAYSIEELIDKFGWYFILRETKIPEGYRTVADEAHMYFKGPENSEIMMGNNIFESAIWASCNCLTTANDVIYADKGAKSSDGSKILEETQYYDPDKGPSSAKGTLFAVVLKRNGMDYADIDRWYPVYGNDELGYTVMDEGGIGSVIEAAKEAQKYGDVVFKLNNNTMQVLLKNLPGKIERYYAYMYETGALFGGGITDVDPQYIIAYYYTEADSLETAADTNTWRVYASKDPYTEEGYYGFDVKFAATIEVPNFENRVYFQKLNEEGELTNGARFALYNADEDENGKLYYIPDGSPNTKIYLDEADYEIDSESGVITVSADGGDYTISPAKNADGNSLVGVTSSSDAYVSENGTGNFGKLLKGRYVLREISPPKGFDKNNAEVKVLVNNVAVYANAGEAGDGVRVGNGPGYVSKSLYLFASQGMIDESLTWVYGLLKVWEPSTKYSEVESWAFGSQTGAYAKKAGDGSSALNTSSETTGNKEEAMITYLVYDETSDSKLFDYSVNGVTEWKDKEGNTVTRNDGTGSRRLFTEVGWSTLAIFQDYEFGSANTLSTTNYDDLRERGVGGNMGNLFSQSTFIQVTDETEIDLSVLKVDRTDGSPLKDVEFVVGKRGEKTTADEYGNETTESVVLYYNNDAGGVSWVENSEDASILKSGDDGTFTLSGLPNGVYYIKETKPLDGYFGISAVISLKVSGGKAELIDEISGASLSLDEVSGAYELKLTNARGREIPSTGEKGARAAVSLGAGLFAAAMCEFELRRRRKPKY